MTAESINVINTIFALGTLIFQAFSVFLIIGLISKDRGPAFQWVAKNALILILLVSIGGVFGSLIYQYVVGFAPCVLCWYQRIVLYPIAIISVAAIVKKHAHFHALSYSMVMAVIGFVLSLWHNIEKAIGKDLLACETSGPSCLQIFVKKFGFIDIPVMSLTFFVLIILIIVNKRRLEGKV